MRKFLLFLFSTFCICFLSAQKPEKKVLARHNGWSTPYYYYLKSKPLEVLDKYFFKAATDKKIVALTFDDGYLSNTPNLLTYLKKNRVPATFFILMGRKEMTADMFKKYDDPLFELGMHSFYHDDYRKVSHARIKEDITNSIQRATSRCPNKKFKYFRPPYGVVDAYATELLRKNKLLGVLWSTDSKDWAGLKGQKLVDNVMADLGAGSIVLMHDAISVSTLDLLCKEIKKHGYQIVPMSQITAYKNEFPK